MNKKLLMAGMLALSGAVHAETVSSGSFTADLNPAFPGIRSYSYAGSTVTLPACGNPVVLLNRTPLTPEVALTKTGADSAEYRLTFKEQAVTITATVAVTRQTLAFTVTDVREAGAFVVRAIEIPGLTLLAGAASDEVALGNFPAPSYASEEPEDHDIFSTVAALEFKDNAEDPPADGTDAKAKDEKAKKAKKHNKNKNRNPRGERGASYAFVSNGKLAAGLAANVMEENLRMIVRTEGEGAARTLAVSPGEWTWREIPSEICPPPQAKLFVAADENGDGRATWQDAAIAYRKNMPTPYGGEKTKLYPVAHIAMNFGSQATNPFLRVLDNAKKIWLYTDGLGQRIQQKGFAGEGHDSSHPDYAGNVGRRQGGRDELNFVMRRGHDFNVLSGVHINAHEYHKEAKAFNPAIANLDAIGWSWLDESYLADYRYDSGYGTLYPRLEAMRADLPWLDFAYLDVYYGRGWSGWRMHTKTNSLGVMQFTEFPGVMERGAVWNHVANDWTQAVWGKGDRSEIARFIYYSQKDTFKHDPLLRGTNCDGFMGWHGETSMLRTVSSAITVNLPTAYLQHFSLIRQEPGKAWFTGGVRCETAGRLEPAAKVEERTSDTITDEPAPPPSDGKPGMTARIFGRDGQLVNSCRYEKPQSRPLDNLVFLPWDPYTEAKIYHWNDKGGDSTWTLPKSWAGVASALLYRLTDLGRVFEREIPVADGKVTLAGIAAATPYVLYRETPCALPDMCWSEGGLVRDTGFDSHSFTAWKKIAGDAGTAIENDAKTGQTELVVRGTAAGAVRQEIGGLEPGQVYAASAWVNIEGKRDATLAVEPAAPVPPPFVDRQGWLLLSSTKSQGKDRIRKLVDGDPKTLWQTSNAKPAPAFPHQLTIGFDRELTLTGFAQTAPADLGEGTVKAFEAWTSLDDKTWTRAGRGEFAYDASGRAAVTFGKPACARYFRLVAVSEIKGRPRTSIAEIEMLTAPGAAAAPFTALSNTINRTVLPNYTDQSSKYMRNWHRVKVLFTAPADGRVALSLRAGEGAADTVVRFDDVRLVKSGVSVPLQKARNVVLFEDFENVDEGWGPFMYGWQGPMNTHFSEANPPYTNDVIGGTFSLKSFKEGAKDVMYRTVPATLKLKPDTRYRVTLDYLSDSAGQFAVVAGTDGGKAQEIVSTTPMTDGSWTVKSCTATFTTDGREGWFIGVAKTDAKKQGQLVIDNLLVEELPAQE